MIQHPASGGTSPWGTPIYKNVSDMVTVARWVARKWIGESGLEAVMACRHYAMLNRDAMVSAIFQMETGYHSSGWWKNPDYDRCFHLSVSFLDPETLQFFPIKKRQAGFVAKKFFPENHNMTWYEGPYSQEGKKAGVNHYRLFCDPGWSPITPRSEVYDKTWTPADWKSFSDIHG